MTVEVGDSVSLLCRVEGSPTPQVTWSRRDGKPVTGWQGPRGVSTQLEAAELLIHSKRTERALACWAVCVGVSHLCASLHRVTLGCFPPACCRLMFQQWG